MGTLVRRRVGQDLCSPVDKVSRMCEVALSEHLFVQERESRRLLKRPIIKLIRQNIARPLISQTQEPSVEVQIPNVNPQSSHCSKNRKPEVQELHRSPVKGEVKRKKRMSVTTKSGVVDQDSAGLPDTPNTLSTPKGKPLSIKKSG